MKHAFVQLLLICSLVAFVAGFLIGRGPRHPAAVLAVKVCGVDSGYLIVMNDGRISRFTAQWLYYHEDDADALDALLEVYPARSLDLGGCA